MTEGAGSRGSAPAGNGSWRLRGYDTLAGEWYPLAGEYPTEAAAHAAATARLQELEEEEQPTAQSGGQKSGGIQDRVFVVRPDGTMYRCGTIG